MVANESETSGIKLELKDNSYNLWMKRGRCSENVWMWVFFIFPLIPYAYYKVGKTRKGFLILGLTIILLAAGPLVVLPVLYGTWDTYSTAKKYNKIYSEQSIEVKSEDINQEISTAITMKDEGKEQPNAVKRPTGITLIGFLNIFGLIVNLFMIYGGLPAMLFGQVVSGSTAQIFYMVSATIAGYLVYGFFKLLKSAWTIAMIFFSFGVVNSFISMLILSQFVMIFGLIFGIVIVSYVQGKKDYFIH